jgi:hypothetical protein
MANKSKYGKYFQSGIPPAWASIGHAGPTVCYLDDRLIKGCFCYTAAMIMRTPPPETVANVNTEWGGISHGPHEHPYPEVIMHLGTNPDDPYDLGAEVELCMGPEMERHIITKSTITFIPAHFIHGPWTVIKVDRPFIQVVLDQGPLHGEKSHPEIVPDKDKIRMAFIDEELGGKKTMRRLDK